MTDTLPGHRVIGRLSTGARIVLRTEFGGLGASTRILRTPVQLEFAPLVEEAVLGAQGVTAGLPREIGDTLVGYGVRRQLGPLPGLPTPLAAGAAVGVVAGAASFLLRQPAPRAAHAMATVSSAGTRMRRGWKVCCLIFVAPLLLQRGRERADLVIRRPKRCLRGVDRGKTLDQPRRVARGVRALLRRSGDCRQEAVHLRRGVL